ncbi:hypothetical protein HGRIS_010224 [Hohenbuehelia grisea]|uniref:Peptidase S53 domain-containing protein n=1 Tax=Hohenbuehelia grisea TaxID=104357 RepID=A0ABR3J3M2_9AGAR
MRLVLLLTALAAPFAFATPASSCGEHKLKERIVPPRGWTLHGPAPADHIIRLRIGLPQPNFPELERHLYAVSDPDSERYGQHFSKEEVDALVAPHPESVSRVDSWLASHGFNAEDIERSSAGDWATVRVPVRVAEKMLNTKYSVWKHAASGDYLVRTTSYSVPEEVHSHIDVIQPTTMFGRFKASKSTVHSFEPESAAAAVLKNAVVSTGAARTIDNPNGGPPVDASCNTTITVNCLKQLYNAVGVTAKPAKGNQIGLTGYLEQFANEADLQQFYADQVPAALNTSFKFISVKGGLNDQNISEAGAEANLDVQFAFGISFPTPGTFYSTAGRPPFIPDVGTPTDTNEPYTDWLDFVLSHPNPPQSISTSYGDDEQTVPRDFAVRACKGFAQLGLRGVSLMFSSGDGGVGDGDPDPATQQCFTNDGRNATRFIPGFPASCPFVTAVGGTTRIPEFGIGFSGGGFSDYFSRPSYQNKAVGKFLAGLPKGTYKGLFNPRGRAIPDVSAQSNRFRIFLSGRPVLIGGTSASSPAFAGFVALLNDVRLAKGKKPLGFLNPLLYSKAVSGFNDITTGNNPGCGTPGFNATKGWDAITGLGTPNFGKLVKLVT